MKTKKKRIYSFIPMSKVRDGSQQNAAGTWRVYMEKNSSISENRISFSRSFSFLLRLWLGLIHMSGAWDFFTPLIRSI